MYIIKLTNGQWILAKNIFRWWDDDILFYNIFDKDCFCLLDEISTITPVN